MTKRELAQRRANNTGRVHFIIKFIGDSRPARVVMNHPQYINVLTLAAVEPQGKWSKHNRKGRII